MACYKGSGVADSRLMVSETVVGTLRRGIGILQALASPESRQSNGLGVVRLAQLLGEDKAGISRALAVMAEYGLVERHPSTRRYQLGWATYVLGIMSPQHVLISYARPILRQLCERLQQQVQVCVLHGDRAVIIEVYGYHHSEEGLLGIGQSVPAKTSAMGRALLSGLTRPELTALYAGSGDADPASTGDLDDLWERLQACAAKGYATSLGEVNPALMAAAAPVLGADASVVASIGTVGPVVSGRHQPALDEIGLALHTTATRIAKKCWEMPWLHWAALEPPIPQWNGARGFGLDRSTGKGEEKSSS